MVSVPKHGVRLGEPSHQPKIIFFNTSHNYIWLCICTLFLLENPH